MLYNKIDELKTVITYGKQRYKVTLKEIYMYNNTNNIIDCHIRFSNFKVQQNFFNNYMAANNYNLAESWDISKIINFEDMDFIAYIYSTTDHHYLKAHLERVKYKNGWCFFISSNNKKGLLKNSLFFY